MSHDLKAALNNGAKPDITHTRRALMGYIGRACEYGSAKYERSNFLRPPKEAHTTADHFNRFRGYLRATVSHLMATLDAMEQHQSGDPSLVDEVGMKRAAYSADTDTKPGDRVGASGLPHVAHAAASLNMAIAQAVAFGLLPEDPGQPWTLRETATEYTRVRVGHWSESLLSPPAAAWNPITMRFYSVRPVDPWVAAAKKPRFEVVPAEDVRRGEPRYYLTKKSPVVLKDGQIYLNHPVSVAPVPGGGASVQYCSTPIELHTNPRTLREVAMYPFAVVQR